MHGHLPVRADAHPRDGGVSEAQSEPRLSGQLQGPADEEADQIGVPDHQLERVLGLVRRFAVARPKIIVMAEQAKDRRRRLLGVKFALINEKQVAKPSVQPNGRDGKGDNGDITATNGACAYNHFGADFGTETLP